MEEETRDIKVVDLSQYSKDDLAKALTTLCYGSRQSAVENRQKLMLIFNIFKERTQAKDAYKRYKDYLASAKYCMQKCKAEKDPSEAMKLFEEYRHYMKKADIEYTAYQALNYQLSEVRVVAKS